MKYILYTNENLSRQNELIYRLYLRPTYHKYPESNIFKWFNKEDLIAISYIYMGERNKSIYEFSLYLPQGNCGKLDEVIHNMNFNLTEVSRESLSRKKV